MSIFIIISTMTMLVGTNFLHTSLSRDPLSWEIPASESCKVVKKLRLMQICIFLFGMTPGVVDCVFIKECHGYNYHKGIV